MSDPKESTETIVGQNNSSPTNEKKMSNGQKIKLTFTLILVALLVTFVVQNLHRVEVQFLASTKRISLVLVILFSALIGSLVTYFLMKYGRGKKK